MASQSRELIAPFVSIATITHNRPQLLALLADCVAAQSYPPERLEWLVIDDSTTGPAPDLTVAIQAGIAVVHRRLERRLPIGAKRNLCHGLASGELLVLMDDDDYYPPTRVAEAVAALSSSEVDVAGCLRTPLLLLPEGSRWLSPRLGSQAVTANSMAYRRRYLEAGHRFDPEAEQAEERSFLADFHTPVAPLDPARSLTCIGHGGNTVDKRLWIARNGEHRFERLGAAAPGFPPAAYLQRYCRALGLPEGPSAASPPPDPATPAASWRVAVVTPYHNESLELLRRCHRSVQAQHYPCTHVLVADGPGQPELADWDCRHIVLGVGHDDNGNTPRSIGALAAMNEGFDCIAFLDADNWLAPDHISRAIATQAEGNCTVVFSDRQIVFPNGQRLTQPPLEDRRHRHVDTSCMVLFAPAFSSLALWAQMPRLLAPQCDRVVFAQLMASQRCGWSKAASVYFETWYEADFLAAGLLPPLNAKFLPRHPPEVWQQAAEAFRQRCPAPVYPGDAGVGPSKPRINLVSILGPARSGGTLLQSGLCRHLGFQGIPEHHFFYHCVASIGPDHRLRHPGALLRERLAQPLPADPVALKPHDRISRGLEQALRSDRTYTLLEAYFRAVQALIPAEAMAFGRSYGQLTVLDRSCSHALVADVLFRCLPEHRAVLMLRDPLEQIAAVRRQQQRYPQAWGAADQPPELQLELTLRALALPLAAAPVGQLQLVLFERLRAQPDTVILEVARFLGVRPSSLDALEPLALPEDHVLNPGPARAYAEQLQQLPQQLLAREPWPQEPWKQDCLIGAEPHPEQGLDPPEPFSDDRFHQLAALLSPVQESMAWLASLADQPELAPPAGLEPDAAAPSSLAVLAAEVANGLVRHGLALRRLEP